MKTLLCIVLLCVIAPAQATYSGSGRSSGSVSYQTRGISGGGGVLTNENFYCPPGAAPELTEQTTPTWGVSDGAALLPVRCMNTALTSTPSPGAVITVAAADNAGFQTALNSAACGQTITLAAGSTYTGTFVLPSHSCTGAQWITIRSTGVTDPNFPAEGVRATPCIAGITNDAVNGYNVPGYPSYAPTPIGTCPVLSAKIISPGGSGNLPAINTASAADHYRFIGIEFTKTPGTQTSQIVVLNTGDKTQAGGIGANHIIFDRSICHGEQWLPTSGAGSETQACIDGTNAQWVAFINGWNYDTYCNSSCIDSQGFKAGTGYYQDGPFKLYNDLLASAGESWIMGGGGVGIGTAVTHDVEIRSNHSFSPLTWMTPVEQQALYPFVPIKKNNGEFKTGIGILLEANYCENSWLGNSDQDGFCFLTGSKSQNSTDAVPLVANGTAVITVGTCSGSGCTPNFSPDMLDATNCAPGGCVLEVNGTAFRFCNGTNGPVGQATCDQSGTTMAAGTTCVLGTDNPLHSTCTNARIFADPANPTAPLPTGTIAFSSVLACHPGKAPGAKVQNVTYRYNTVSNVINGFQIATGVSSHCKDESLGTSNLTYHDNLLIGLDINMTDGSDPDNGASCFIISNGQISNVMNSVDVVHNHCVVATGSVGSTSGLGQQGDHTDIGYLSGLNVHDNVSAAPWVVSRTQGTIVGGGLATAWQTDACRAYYPAEAPTGIVQADSIQNFTFSAIPGGLNYLVTLNGLSRALTSPTNTSFTLTTATHVGDTISIRDKTQCNWTFRSNLLGTGSAMPGEGADQSPYPDGTIQASANNTIACGPAQTLTCLLNENTGNAFTTNFLNWIGRGGNYALKPGSVYVGTAWDAASRLATGKSPGADLTTLTTLQQGVAAGTALPQLTVTSGVLTPQATAGTAYSNALTSTNGASQFWPGYKSWFLATDPLTCQGNCGALPANSGIVIGRSGVVNGPFLLLTAKRAVQACGSAGTVACSTITIKQTIVAGALQLNQVVLLTNFENGTSTATINDGTFNGSCTITIIATNSFSCPQTGTGADTIPSHNPNSFWQGVWKTTTTYAISEQVLYNNIIYASLQNTNKAHQPDISPTFWSVLSPVQFVPGVRATFAPVTSGTYTWWMGVRDGAFQFAYGQIQLKVN